MRQTHQSNQQEELGQRKQERQELEQQQEQIGIDQGLNRGAKASYQLI